MRIAFFFSLFLLVALASTAYGVAIGVYRIWPYLHIRLIKDEWRFIYSDFMGSVDRLLVMDDSIVLNTLRPIESEIPFGKSIPLIALKKIINGYTVIIGVFDINSVQHAALLLDPTGKVIHSWLLNENQIKRFDKRSIRHKFPHGFVVLPDGSVIFSFDGGVSLQRHDACGRLLWANLGKYHHAVTLTENKQHIWTLVAYEPAEEDRQDQARRSGVQRIRVTDGTIDDSFTIRDIIEANPRLDIFGIRQLEENEFSYRWDADPMHDNDVDPLPAALADAFPMFKPGDLLLSLRALNLIVVVDPDTKDVKWFTMGRVRRQHDPDWQPDGSITIFDNNMHRGASYIVRLDPKDSESVETMVDGEDLAFYTWIQGKHQVTANGEAVLITSPRQGRVFEVDLSGNVVFEFVNQYENLAGRRFFVSEAIRLPRNYFEEGALDKCAE